MSIALPQLINGTYDFKISSDVASWLATMMSIGSWFGDFTAYLLINSFGKKNLIFASIFPLLVSWILTAAGPSAPYLFLGKFIAGFADGILFTTVPTFMAEIASPEIRGLLGSTYSVTLVLGMLLMNILLFFLSIRTASYIATVLCVPLFFTFPFLPDSAYHYILKNDADAAKASLQKYGGKADVDDDLLRISKAVKDETENEGGILDIIRDKTSRKALIIAVALCMLNQFTGIMGVLMYCTTVFEESKSFLNPEVSNIIFFVVYFIAVSIAALVVDKYGRRLLLIISSTGAGLCLTGTATFSVLKQYSIVDLTQLESLQLVILLIHITIYAFGLNSVPILVASEIFTPNMKGIGLCITNLSYSISSLVVIKYFTFINDHVGMYLAFYTFACVAFITVMYAIIYLPETKEKTLEEIQSMLGKKDNVKDSTESSREKTKL